MSSALFSVRDGLVSLGPKLIDVRDRLEERFLGWASEIDAEARSYPPLIAATELHRLDYFRNFPHLAVVASHVRPERLDEVSDDVAEHAEVPQTDLGGGKFVLPSAACFSIYLDLQGKALDAPRFVTTVATCFRNENEFTDLRRLWSFTMREIVCVGPSEAVQDHLRSFKRRILGFLDRIALPVTTQHATDPFFQRAGSRAVLQKLFPQKEEFVYGGDLAIGSLNFHRNFFGERCDIRLAEGGYAFTGCVAFGIERWLYALLDRFDGDVDTILRTIGTREPRPTRRGEGKE